jgi:hypothetical protein
MTKYLVLYRAPLSAREQMAKATAEQAKAGMDMWMTWSKRTGAALVDMGSPLGDGVVVGDRPAAAPSGIGGYSVLQVESLEAAKKHFDGHPHLHTPGGWIELFEFIRLPGM